MASGDGNMGHASSPPVRPSSTGRECVLGIGRVLGRPHYQEYITDFRRCVLTGRRADRNPERPAYQTISPLVDVTIPILNEKSNRMARGARFGTTIRIIS